MMAINTSRHSLALINIDAWRSLNSLLGRVCGTSKRASVRKPPRFITVCNSHTLRELKALIEFEKEPWASDLQTILLDALQLTKTTRSQSRDAVVPEAIKEIERRFDAYCEQAITFHENQSPLTPPSIRKKRGRRKRRIGHNLALRFKALKTAVFLFLNDLTVPFTNNEAERDLRMTKVRQKVSGCFRAEEGAESFCILPTVIETARKQGWDIMQTLRAAPDQLILMLKVA